MSADSSEYAPGVANQFTGYGYGCIVDADGTVLAKDLTYYYDINPKTPTHNNSVSKFVDDNIILGTYFYTQSFTDSAGNDIVTLYFKMSKSDHTTFREQVWTPTLGTVVNEDFERNPTTYPNIFKYGDQFFMSAADFEARDADDSLTAASRNRISHGADKPSYSLRNFYSSSYKNKWINHYSSRSSLSNRQQTINAMQTDNIFISYLREVYFLCSGNMIHNSPFGAKLTSVMEKNTLSAKGYESFHGLSSQNFVNKVNSGLSKNTQLSPYGPLIRMYQIYLGYPADMYGPNQFFPMPSNASTFANKDVYGNSGYADIVHKNMYSAENLYDNNTSKNLVDALNLLYNLRYWENGDAVGVTASHNDWLQAINDPYRDSLIDGAWVPSNLPMPNSSNVFGTNTNIYYQVLSWRNSIDDLTGHPTQAPGDKPYCVRIGGLAYCPMFMFGQAVQRLGDDKHPYWEDITKFQRVVYLGFLQCIDDDPTYGVSKEGITPQGSQYKLDPTQSWYKWQESGYYRVCPAYLWGQATIAPPSNPNSWAPIMPTTPSDTWQQYYPDYLSLIPDKTQPEAAAWISSTTQDAFLNAINQAKKDLDAFKSKNWNPFGNDTNDKNAFLAHSSEALLINNFNDPDVFYVWVTANWPSNVPKPKSPDGKSTPVTVSVNYLNLILDQAGIDMYMLVIAAGVQLPVAYLLRNNRALPLLLPVSFLVTMGAILLFENKDTTSNDVLASLYQDWNALLQVLGVVKADGKAVIPWGKYIMTAAAGLGITGLIIKRTIDTVPDSGSLITVELELGIVLTIAAEVIVLASSVYGDVSTFFTNLSNFLSNKDQSKKK